MRALAAAVTLLALAIAAPRSARAVDADAVSRCHQEIANGIRAVKRGRIKEAPLLIAAENIGCCKCRRSD